MQVFDALEPVLDRPHFFVSQVGDRDLIVLPDTLAITRTYGCGHLCDCRSDFGFELGIWW